MKGRLVPVFLVALTLSGCTTYYRVTDPATERVYYTTDLKKLKGGAVELTNAKNKTKVTLQTSEVETISKVDYNTNVYGQ
jgi:hypothetical protein